MSAQKSRLMNDTAMLLGRVALGAYVAVAGFRKVKAEINDGVGTFLRGNYAARQPHWIPEFIATPYGYALPWLELGLGLLVLVGLFGRVSSWAMTLMLLSIAVALAYNWELVKLEPPTVHHILPMIALAFWLALSGAGSLSIDHLIRRKAA
jgi:uncharacterized membrane protein YphA (DoxX/SURF4 family)